MANTSLTVLTHSGWVFHSLSIHLNSARVVIALCLVSKDDYCCRNQLVYKLLVYKLLVYTLLVSKDDYYILALLLHVSQHA